MSIKAAETVQGVRYRPTRVGSFDLRGRSWFTRAAPGWEKRAVARLRKRSNRLTGKEVSILLRVDGGGVLLRRHWKPRGCKTVQSEWMAVPRDYTLRAVGG